MASRLYRSTDAGAPQLAGTAKNALNTVLKAVLVDGYGDKTSLGWELAFQDADAGICVFRPRVGSRMFLQITDDGTSVWNGRMAQARSFESMQSAVLGQGPSPVYGIVNNVVKTYYTNNTTQKWEIIGDERGFYFIIFPISTDTNADMKRNRAFPFYFGEYNTISGTSNVHNYNWITMITIQNNIDFTLHSTTLQCYTIRNPFNPVRGSEYVKYDAYDFIEASNANNNPFKLGVRAASAYATIYDNKIRYSPVILSLDNTAYKTYALGTLPGMLVPAFAIAHNPNKGIIEDVIDENNKIILYPSIGYANVSYYITNNYNGTYDNAFGIILGDKFRNVY